MDGGSAGVAWHVGTGGDTAPKPIIESVTTSPPRAGFCYESALPSARVPVTQEFGMP